MMFLELERGDVVIDFMEGSAGHAWLVLTVTPAGGLKVAIEWLNLGSGEVLVSTSQDEGETVGEGFSVLRGGEEVHL